MKFGIVLGLLGALVGSTQLAHAQFGGAQFGGGQPMGINGSDTRELVVPMDVVFCVDNSGSMNGYEELAARMFNEIVAAKAAKQQTDAAESARLAAIDIAFGYAADVSLSSEDLHRERREDAARDEAQYQRQFGQGASQ